MSKGSYAQTLNKYMLQLRNKNRLTEKYYDLLMDWYSTYVEIYESK